MANYTAADIKALRERTGAGMLDVKKALDAADGDAEKAIEIIRTTGLDRAAKREGNTASEGLMQRHSGGSKTGAEAEVAAEPLAEWERELLAGAEGTVETPAETAEGTVAAASAEAAEAATPAAPSEVVEAAEAAEAVPAAAPAAPEAAAEVAPEAAEAETEK